MLHIISHSLFKFRPAGIDVALLNPQDAVLLLGDGIYSASHPDIQALQGVYAIEEDRIARGLPKHPHISHIDYAAMVTLTEHHHPVVTWR